MKKMSKEEMKQVVGGKYWGYCVQHGFDIVSAWDAFWHRIFFWDHDVIPY
ncbi:MAG: bacteriocin [Lachnospiraceae bacterium]|nr:bacteriocin [Lachnospiraceae bacterium]MBP5281999.1 bacteriocin [Lachnospiraceae bacterium]MBR6477372.1 bacteriocin [Lachnospiraceae bacterium]